MSSLGTPTPVSFEAFRSALYTRGSIDALEAFREELLAHRGRIENELEPPLDVVLDLLDRVVAVLRERALDGTEASADDVHPDQLNLAP
jgi:hypothetical protein